MTNLAYLSLQEAVRGLANREFSSADITQEYLTRAKDHEALNAYITLCEESAMEEARASDDRIARGQARPLEGVPIAIKDLFCTKGVRTTAASKMLENFIPRYESTISGKLRDAGAVMLGKTNLDEFAMGSANSNSHFGQAVNPHGFAEGRKLVPGGSSGGSAAAVSAFLCSAATGTDTGGSIRQPAAFTGTVGMKPTYGRCSRFGTVAFASSLDQAGPMTRSVTDAAIMLQHMAGFDAQDSTSSQRDVPDWAGSITHGVKGKTVGIPREYRMEGANAEIDALWDKAADMLRDAGAQVREISLKMTHYALPAYYIIAPAEASSNLARYDGVRYGHRTEQAASSLDEMYARTRAEGFGDEVKKRILIGTYVLSHGYYDAYYKKAQRVRRLIAQDFADAFEEVDFILTPTTPSAAFAADNPPTDPVEMYKNDIFTVTASMAGLPAISVPVGTDSGGLPLGMQIIGRAFDEDTVLRAGYALEQAAQFNAKPEGF